MTAYRLLLAIKICLHKVISAKLIRIHDRKSLLQEADVVCDGELLIVV